MNDDETYYPWRWRLEYLLRGLSTERSCLADSIKGCWIIDELDSWNSALRAARLVLTEFEPGKLRLRSYDDRVDYQPKRDSGGNVTDGAFLAAWLPRQHSCIHDVRVYDTTHFDWLSFVSSVIVGPMPNIKCVVLHPRNSLQPGNGFLQAFGPPQCLRCLDLSNVHLTDVLANNVAVVLRENASTLISVKFVGNTLSPEPARVLLLALASCEWLKDLTLEDSIGFSSCSSIAMVIRCSRVIQKLSLVGLCKANIRCKHYGVACEWRICLHCLTDLFAALEGALWFQDLTLENTSICHSMAEVLAQFIAGHRSLQTLSLVDCSFDIEGATYIAEALSANSSLEYLNLPKCSLAAQALGKLCSAVHVSTTLRNLALPVISNTSPVIQKGNPTLELLRLECPGRIKFRLFVDQPSLVSEALEMALGCATNVDIYHGWSGEDVISSVYASLALNQSLRSLRIDYNHKSPAGPLCTALKAFRHLQTFHLDVCRSSFNNNEKATQLLNDVLDALKHSPCLRRLSLVTPQLALKTAETLSLLVAQCRRSLLELRIVTVDNMSDSTLGELRKMVTKNVFLTIISVRCLAWKDAVLASAAIDDAKEHNRCLLNKAARFVMSFDAGPAAYAEQHYAAAFDELCGTASLQEHLEALSGKSGLEVSSDVKRAWRFVRDNYMVLAGIVRTSVVFEGDGDTRLNELNADCWRAIVQYLKLSDVVR